ncbi:alpha/beta fold hydrolase [Flindersiella endophytica]
MTWYGPDGRRIYYESTGLGEPVLMLPGWGGSIVDLDRLRHQLGQGFRLIAADLPGSGRSEPQPRDYAASFYADDARTFLGLLDDLGVSSAHLVGFSDGGETALLMAALEPSRALSVVTWGAAGQVVPAPGSLDALERLLDEPSEFFLPLAAYLVEAYGVEHARAMAASWSRALRAIADAGGDISRSRAGRISCPALLMTGTYDPFCPPELVRELAEAIPGGRFLEVPGGHDLHTSDLRVVATAIAGWLSEH